MIYALTETKNNESINKLIATCKSNSNVVGTSLRKAHYHLGCELANTYKLHFSNSIAICFLRGGLPFSMGVADTLDCPILFFDDKTMPDFFNQNIAKFQNKQILLIDSVINSGKGMLKAAKELHRLGCVTRLITNVLCSKALDKLAPYETYAIRISENSFKGSDVKVQSGNKGPDTGDRLFRIGANA